MSPQTLQSRKISRAKAAFLRMGAQLAPGGAYVVDGENEATIDALVRYAIGEDGPLDLSKGLLLLGNVGSGKSTALRIVAHMRRMMGQGRAKSLSCLALRDAYERGGLDRLEEALGSAANVAEAYFDDLGTEEPLALYMGNRLNVMRHVVEKRYNGRALSHFSSNKSRKGLLECYGDRVESRLAEMCNFVAMVGKDRRR